MAKLTSHSVFRRLCAWQLITASALVLLIIAARFLLYPFSSDETFGQMPASKLRIMALGDSITEGYRSSDGNGYRLQLLRKLEHAGSEVEYVGTLRTGNMENNHNEGYGGLAIKQIAAQDGVNATLGKKPNVVLLHAGTNDMHTDYPEDPYASAPKRLGSLIDQVFASCSTAVVIVAQIIQCSCPFPGSELRIPVFNAQIVDVVAEREKLGYRITTVDMSSIGVNGSDLDDGLHPNDVGYGKMAAFWYQALHRVAEHGWISHPE